MSRLLAIILGGLLATAPSRLDDLVAAERAFAARSPVVGQRQAFLEYFSDRCISFNPEPGIAVARLQSRPTEKAPFSFVLQWAPVNGDISVAGDMGYTTGPYVVTGADGKLSHGLYFSIWKKEADWKVIADLGVPLSAPFYSLAERFSRATVTSGGRFQPAPASTGGSLDKALSEAVRNGGEQSAYSALGTADLRIYRDGMAPLIGKAASEKLVSGVQRDFSLDCNTSEISDSFDIAYSIGSFREKGKKGYYLHLWKQVARNQWRLAAEIRTSAS